MKNIVVAASLALTIALVAPRSVNAENVRVPRIGYLASDPPTPQGPGFDVAFREAMSEIGYVEGQNIEIEWRYASGKMDLLPAMAAELVRHGVDLIVTDSTRPTVAAKDATRTI